MTSVANDASHEYVTNKLNNFNKVYSNCDLKLINGNSNGNGSNEHLNGDIDVVEDEHIIKNGDVNYAMRNHATPADDDDDEIEEDLSDAHRLISETYYPNGVCNGERDLEENGEHDHLTSDFEEVDEDSNICGDFGKEIYLKIRELGL